MLNDFLPADADAVRPYIYEDERTLSMHFDMSATQSRMRRADPCALDLAYTRTMMACLMLQPRPASMLMIGLGGGSLAKYWHRWLRHADVSVVEINPHVIAMREDFFVPPDGERFRVLQGDGAAVMEENTRPHDVVFVDGFNYDGQPEGLCTPAFYADCRRAIGDTGVLVVNLHDEEPQCTELTARLRDVLGDGLVHVDQESGGNRIVFGAAPALLRAAAEQWDERWSALDEVHRHTLARCAERVRRSLGRWLVSAG
ncbi:transferase [Albitalea terrae]|uniref:Transferase n=2 Tax=Piscinibacter terrae TaxID=2496871 RepID=A0A3N7K5P4_9BURK|nr:transferase [Albitalea terrae]